MVKILELGNERPLHYWKVKCPICGTVAAFETKDIWFEAKGARIECPNPKCKMKVFLNETPTKNEVTQINKEEYDNACGDHSKSGLQMLMAEKEKELN